MKGFSTCILDLQTDSLESVLRMEIDTCIIGVMKETSLSFMLYNKTSLVGYDTKKLPIFIVF
jgi:hypothetical protein